LEQGSELVQEIPAVLLIHWRRHRFLLPQIDALRDAGITKFYIACDGPRETSDEAVLATQDAILRLQDSLRREGLKVEVRLSSQNLGCEKGVLSAIDWFFSNEEEGIVLEDDCAPGVEFVPFVALMLNKYRDDTSVFAISGENSTTLAFATSYGFVAHPFIWGWATWRNRWLTYSSDDRQLKTWQGARTDETAVKKLFPNTLMRTVWARRLDRLLFESVPDTWDYQLTYFCRSNAKLCIVPAQNLVVNLGDEDDGTHITRPTARTGRSLGSVFPIRHPRAVRRSDRHEFLFFWRDEGRRRAMKLLARAHKSPYGMFVALRAFSAALIAAVSSGLPRTWRWN